MTKTRGVGVQLAIAAIVALTLVRLLSISERYPYYFIWDLDHTTELDTLLINSGLLPDHLGHPGFGMYLLLSASEKTARAIDALSIGTLDDVDASLNPIGGMAERTDYLRRHAPFACVAIVLMLWAALRLMFRLPWWCVLLFLLLLASQESLSYHASLIRTELYSVLFWSAATLAAAMVARARRAWSRDLGHLVVGLLLGLSFLTKVQALFYLAAAICILLLFRSLAGDADGAESPPVPPAASRRREHTLAAVSVLNIIFFLGVAAASIVTHIPEGVATFASSQGVTPVAVAMGLGMTVLLCCHVMAARGRRIPLDGAQIAGVLTVIATGFFLSFALHFLIILTPSVSWLYLVYDFKMVFVRKTFYQADASSFIGALAGFVGHNPLMYLTHVALLAGLAAGRASRTLRVSREQLFWCAAASLMAFVNLGLGSRFILRDGIWAETLVNLLSLTYLAIIVTRAVGARGLLSAAGTALVAAMVLVNGALSSTMTQRIDANYNRYGWDSARWASAVYGFNQPRYAAIIERKYDADTLRGALRAAIDHAEIRRTAEFVFPSQSPNHRNIGIAALHMPVWGRNQRYRIAALPPALEGAIIVDPSSIPNRGRPLFKEEMVRGDSEYFDKFKASSSADLLPVLPRRDLRVLMFVRVGDESAFQSAFITPAALTITLRTGDETIEMKGMEVTNYSEVAFRPGSGRYFFVITRP